MTGTLRCWRYRLTRRCSDPDLVEDALQDTFVAAWKGGEPVS